MENLIKKYNFIRKELESRFAGLPHIHTTLIKSLITIADPTTGIVSNISYHELAKLLTVDPAPGRKGAGMPQKETIRSYLRTISDNCPEDFRVISQGQKLKCQFSSIPKIYAHFFDQKKEYTDEIGKPDTDNLMEDKEKPWITEASLSREHTTVLPVDNMPVKNINILTNKTNKQIAPPNPNPKRAITPDFYPNQETIDIALSRGLVQVENQDEIQKFIQYNLDNDCLWADFNPVFINWLERGFEYQLLKQKKIKTHRNSRSGCYERATHKKNSYAQIMEQVRRDNMDACAPSDSLPKQGEYGHLFDIQPHIMALDSAHRNIRPAFS